MGKIYDRLKARSAAARVSAPEKATAPRDVRQTLPAEQLRTDDQPLLRRMNALLSRLDEVRTGRLGALDRHEIMQELAAEAKAVGLKGQWGALCNRTQCLRKPATWYNRGSHAFYCTECARELNSANARDAEEMLGKGQRLCTNIPSQEEASKLHTSP
jgi:hypothetical protein